jgi:tetratricopeptide (TPR) repeat protein
MVIGSLRLERGICPATCIVLLAAACLTLRAVADDQIVKNDGSPPIVGHITGVSDGAANILTRTPSGGTASFPIMISDIKSISMDAPAAVKQAETPGTPPGQVIPALEGPVNQFAGLPAQWVIDAMAQLGDAYSQVGQTDKALEIYNKIGSLYPHSSYVNVANASRAQVDVEAGKLDEAMQIVQPIVDKANQDIAPSPVDGATYAKAFIVYGRVLEAQKKLPQALEAFLTVKTMFYQNPNLVAEADHYAQDLRTKNPGLGVD